jgi:aconitate hydratase
VAKDSKRLQLLTPFAPWDGKDFVELPLLLKAKGKCTTDHISPAGPWLRFRGHLDNISDNMFTGAISAFTGEASASIPKKAREYKAKGLRWIVVGDENYGEGSSREHAAMSPRFLGCAAVIVRSLARLHESNLKKQGILPLTFVNPADYDKVLEGDLVSIVGLASLAPGADLTAKLHHTNGTEDTIKLRHTLNAEQIGWSKAGSALNVIKRG